MSKKNKPAKFDDVQIKAGALEQDGRKVTKPKLSKLDVRRTAYHVAGHAVVAAAYKVRFAAVRVGRDGARVPGRPRLAYDGVIEYKPLTRKQMKMRSKKLFEKLLWRVVSDFAATHAEDHYQRLRHKAMDTWAIGANKDDLEHAEVALRLNGRTSRQGRHKTFADFRRDLRDRGRNGQNALATH